MKNFKRIFISSVLVIAAFFAFIFGGLSKSLPTKKVKAADNMTVTFEVYKEDKYNVRANFSTRGYDYETAKREYDIYVGIRDHHDQVNPYDADGENFDYLVDEDFTGSWEDAANAWWNAEFADSGSTEDQNLEYNYYPSLGTGVDIVVKDGKKTKKVNALGKAVTDIAAAVKVYEDAAPETEFAPGNNIVIVPVCQGNNVGLVELYFDALFPSTDNTSNLFSATEFGGSSWDDSFFIFDNSSWDVGSNKDFIVGGSTVSHPYVRNGGEFATYSTNQETGSTSDTIRLLGMKGTIDSSANGTFNITIGNSTSSHWISVPSDPSKFADYNYPTSMTVVATQIEVAGASNVAGVSGVSIGSTPLTHNTSGTTIGGKTYDSYTATSQPNTTTSVNVVPAAAKGGHINKVVYGDNLGTLLTAGTTAPETSGSYKVTLGAPNTTTYAAINITSADGTTTDWVIVEIPKSPLTDCYLDGYTVSATGGTLSTVTSNPGTFASGTTSYTLSFEEGATALDFTPTFDTTGVKGMTCKVNGTPATTGSTVSVPTSLSSFKVEVYAQDGTTKKVYTFTFNKLSNSTSLSSAKIGTTNATKNATGITIGGKVYEDWKLAGQATGTASVNVAFTAANSAKIKNVIFGTDASTVLTSGTAATLVSGTTYKINLGAGGTTTYAAVQLESQSTVKTEWVIVEIPVNKYNVASMDSYTAVSAGGSTTTLVSSPASFSPTVYNYTLSVAADATKITFTPTFDTAGTYGMTCTVNGTAVTSGNSVDVSAGLSSFDVIITAQDGTTTKKYTYAITKLSNDTSITITAPGYTVNPVVGNPNKFTIDNVPFATNSINFTASNTGTGVSITRDSATTNIKGVSQTLTLTANGKLASKTTVTLTVKSASGMTEAYTLEVNRIAANTNNIATVDVYANDGTPITGTWTGNVFNASSPLDIKYTGFYIVATADAGADGLSTLKFDSSTITSGSPSATKAFGSAITQVDKSFNLDVISESGVTNTYTIKVSRRAYDTDTTYTYTVVDSSGKDITSSFVANSSGIISNQTAALDTKITYVNITVTPATSTTKALIGTTDYAGTVYKLTTTAVKTPGVVNNVTYAITPEASPINITFKVYMNALENIKYIDEVTISGSVDLSATTTFSSVSPTTTNFDFSIDKDTNGNNYDLKLTPKSNRATIYVTQATTGFNSINVPANEYTSTITGLEIGKLTYFRVYAENGDDYVDYTVNVTFTDKRDKDPSFKSLKVYVTDYTGAETELTTFAFDPSTAGQAKIKLPYTVTSIRFAPVYNKPNTTLYAGNLVNSLVGVTNTTLHLQSQAQNDDYKSTDYIFTIEREAAETGNYITDLKINGTSAPGFTSSDNKFAYVTNRNDVEVTVDVTVSKNARYTASFDTYSYQASPFKFTGLSKGSYKILTISVESEKSTVDSLGSLNVYSIYVFTADTSTSITGVQILDTDEYGSDLTNASGSTYTYDASDVNVPFAMAYSSNNPYIVVNKASSYISITGDGAITVAKSTSAQTTKPVSVVIRSEYGRLLDAAGFTVPSNQERTINYKFTRNKPSSENNLTELKFTFASTNASKSKTYTEAELKVNRIITFEQLGQNPVVSIDYIKKDPNAVVTGLSDPDVSGVASGSSYEAMTIAADSTVVYNLVCTSEAGTKATYTITFASGDAVLDGESGIQMITVEGDVVSGDVLAYSATKPNTYNVVIRAINDNAKVMVTPISNKSKITVNTDTYNQGDIKLVALDKTTGSTVITVVSTSQDGKNTTTITINITTPAPDSDSSLKGLTHVFSATNESVPGFTSAKKDYKVYVPNSVTSYYLVPATNSTNAIIDSNNAKMDSPLTLNIGSNNAVVVVKAEDGTKTTYTVEVIRDDVTGLTDLVVEDADGNNLIASFDPDTKTYTLPDLPYGTKTLNVSFITAGDPTLVNVKVEGNTNLLAGKNNQIKVTATAASGANTVYTINAKVTDGATGNSITAYKTENGEDLLAADFATDIITYVVPRDKTVFNPVISVSDGASWKITSPTGLVAGQINTKTIVVTSQTGVDKSYTVNVYPCDTELRVSEIEVFGAKGDSSDYVDLEGNSVVFDPLTKTYSLHVPFSTKSLYVQVTGINALQQIYIENKCVNDLANPSITVGADVKPQAGKTISVPVYMISEYGKAASLTTGDKVKGEVYTINITQDAADDDATLASLVVKVGGVPVVLSPSFDKDILNYSVNDIGTAATSIKLDATVSKPGKTQILTDIDSVISLPVDKFDETYQIITQAESGSKLTYRVSIHRLAVSADDDNSITYIKLTSSDKTNTYVPASHTWAANKTVDVTIDSQTTSIQFEVGRPLGSHSTIYFTQDGNIKQANDQNTFTSNATDSMYGRIVVYTVYAVSKNGEISDVYTFNVEFTEKSKLNTLADLKINGATVPGFSPDKTEGYEISVPYQTSAVSVSYTLADPKLETIDMENSTLPMLGLNVGDNYAKVTVVSESNASKTYLVKIVRQDRNPYLTDLRVAGKEYLCDASNKRLDFDSEVYDYYTTIEYNPTANVTFTVDYKSTYFATANDCNPIYGSGTATFTSINTFYVGVEVVYIIEVTGTVSTNKSIYRLHVTMEPEKSKDTSINSMKVSEVFSVGGKQESTYGFEPAKNAYTMTVDNKTMALEIMPNVAAGATYDITQNVNALQPGLNVIVITVIAENTDYIRQIVFNVNRAEMEFTVGNLGTYANTEVSKADNKYTVNIGSKKASSFTENDYINMVDWNKDTNGLVVTVKSEITDDTSDVVLAVFDGVATEYVLIHLDRHIPSASLFDFSDMGNLVLWLILLIAIVLLAIILYSVNKDKYGSINKTRKRSTK